MHLFYAISCAIRKGRYNFFSSKWCCFMHTLSYHFLQTFERLSLIYMNGFNLRHLPTFHLQPYVSTLFRYLVTWNWQFPDLTVQPGSHFGKHIWHYKSLNIFSKISVRDAKNVSKSQNGIKTRFLLYPID